MSAEPARGASGRGASYLTRQPGIPPAEKTAKQRRIIGAHGRAHRWPRRKRLAPALKIWLACENSEVGDVIEHIEIAEHRAEHGINQRKVFAVKPWRGRN